MTSIEPDDGTPTVSVRPGVGMLALFPAMKYKAWYALGELVDNALQSYLSNKEALQSTSPTFRLRVEVEFSTDQILVRDNAAGIRGQDIERAFSPAQPPPDRTGLSQFGIGMKSAACWYANRFRVETTALNEDLARVVEVDIDRILTTRSDLVQVHPEPAPSSRHGTTVVLDRLNQPVPTGRTLGKIRSYLRSIYREFLRSGEIELIVGGDVLRFNEPEILTAPRWDDPRGAPQQWKKDVNIILPHSGRRIVGWVAIRARGSTQEAGLALLHRGKVVVGAGSMAQDSDGSYRPDEIFGRANSFAYQRIFGELDVSGLGVAYSKDDVIWGGQEDDFLEALRTSLDAEPLPILKMANGYRRTEHRQSVDSTAAARRAVAAAADAASRSFGSGETNAGAQQNSTFTASTGGQSQAVAAADHITADLSLPEAYGITARLAVGHDESDSRLLRITKDLEIDVIHVNRAARFLRSFAPPPDGDIEPILRLCVAVALAEIEARRAGQAQAAMLRTKLNQLLDGPLSSRMDVEDE